MPPIDKAKRRDERHRKEREGKFLGVRYNTLRSGESLAAFEAERKTTVAGKRAKRHKKPARSK